jgi:hypothetical protein
VRRGTVGRGRIHFVQGTQRRESRGEAHRSVVGKGGVGRDGWAEAGEGEVRQGGAGQGEQT